MHDLLLPVHLVLNWERTELVIFSSSHILHERLLCLCFWNVVLDSAVLCFIDIDTPFRQLSSLDANRTLRVPSVRTTSLHNYAE